MKRIYVYIYLSIYLFYLYMNMYECLEINCGFCHMMFEILCNLILIYLVEIKKCSNFFPIIFSM